MSGLFSKALRSGTARTALAVGGVSASALLVLVLLATYRSLTAGVAEYTGQNGIDLWVAPAGTDNLIRSSALLPAGLSEAVSSLDRVSAAAPLLRNFVRVRLVEDRGGSANKPGKEITLLCIGYKVAGGLGGPPRLVFGRAPAGEGEVVLDRAAAHRLGADTGDRVSLNGRLATVVGLSRGTNLMATQFVFLDAAAAARSSGFGAQASFLAVALRPGARPARVAREIRRLYPAVSVYTRRAFVRNNLREVAAGFLPLQLIVSVVGVLAAAVLVALLVHAVVEDRRGEVAVLLAMGAGSGVLAQAVIAYAARLVVLGSALGAVVTLCLREALERWLPTVELSFRATDVAAVVLLFGTVGVLAAVAPLLRLRRIDPIKAFRS